MTNLSLGRMKSLSVQLALAATVTSALPGCATVTTPESVSPQDSAPSTSCRTSPSAESTAKVLAAGVLGALLDKATGGGDGFQRGLASTVDENLHKKCVDKGQLAVSAAAPAASAPAFNK